MRDFYGRKEELRRLRLLLTKSAASLVVIRGRRRIGKSRLIAEFAKPHRCHTFSGIPVTTQTTKQKQLDEFCRQVSEEFSLGQFRVGSWGTVFRKLAELCSGGRVILSLDEISWIGSKDPDFLGHLKNAWDLYFSTNPDLILIVCGSVSSWIEENLLSSTGFVGRVSLEMQLKELPLSDAVKFWKAYQDRVGAHEMLRVLSVTGGVPRYLEEILPQLSAEENIHRMCFHTEGTLLNEFDRIFSDLFTSRASLYKTILQQISAGPRTFTEVGKALGGKLGGIMSGYMKDLSEAGFITGDPTWNLSSMKTSNMRRYRLSDNYMRFYLLYLLPRKDAILQGTYEHVPLTTLPGWDTVIGLQFENVVINNVHPVLEMLGINPVDVLRFGPFFQRKTVRAPGCQIDLLIQTRFKTVYLCEIKFLSGKVGLDVGREAESRFKRLMLPRGWSNRRVLVHVNGCTRELQQSYIFDHVIDFAELLS